MHILPMGNARRMPRLLKCACAWACIHAHTEIHMHTHLSESTWVCMHAHTQEHTCTHLSESTWVCMHAHAHTSEWEYMSVHAHSCMCAHTHTHFMFISYFSLPCLLSVIPGHTGRENFQFQMTPCHHFILTHVWDASFHKKMWCLLKEKCQFVFGSWVS